MTTKLRIRSVHAGALITALVFMPACSGFFDVPNTNQPNLEDLVTNPTRSKLIGAATGIFSSARSGIQNYIWRLGSLGREGINLSGNNQPDYSEPYFGPLQSTGFGGTQWTDRYQNIRNINVFLDALERIDPAAVSSKEKAGGRAVANTLKALAFTYVILTRDTIGAPVDVDQPITAPPAHFVTKDSVYGYILALLDSAQADLVRADTVVADTTKYFFTVPPGFSGFDKPATFGLFNRALAAKVEVLRATAASCGAPCYDKAITALAGSFFVADASQFGRGVSFDFSAGSGDITNTLSEPLNGVTFFAHPSDSADAQTQPGGQPDQRVLNKLAPLVGPPQQLGGIPGISGTQKFTVYLTGGQADPGHSIPIIRNEELVLLDAEAQWFRSVPNKLQAIADINLVRQNAGGLAVTTVTVASPDSDFVKELVYNRRYSLLWEQGTRWIDARRFNRLTDIVNEAPSFPFVPRVMPLPKGECDRRGLGDNCQPPRS
jgi:starch-binding outer membrane protein, SusD/RagB family